MNFPRLMEVYIPEDPPSRSRLRRTAERALSRKSDRRRYRDSIRLPAQKEANRFEAIALPCR